ncbi:MAG: YebC/PmpR family DNA-binding transcriptional regulator [Candidatus Moraniibacteriota bacterium]
MSGHSHWAGIKQRKGVNDAKRAGVFTKIAKIVTIAARDGGSGDPTTNFHLRLAIDQARSFNMPKDNIDRAIKRGTGELKDGTEIVENTYEGYGPGNVAMIIKTVTDSANRTVSEIKSLFTKGGGKFVPSGSLNFLFQSVGVIETVALDSLDIEATELAIIEAGADDFEHNETNDESTPRDFFVFTAPDQLQVVSENLRAQGFTIRSASLAYRPTQTVELTGEALTQYENFREKIENHDDVDRVYDNLA